MNDAVQPAAGATAGQLLRHAREAAGMHVATLAVALKVPVRKLEALEEDRYDELSDAVFVRALASSVCRTLKVDPQPVLALLPQGSKPRLLQSDDGINAPFRAPGDGPTPGVLDQVTRPVGLVVVALLLGALVIVLLPTVQRDETAQAPKPETETVVRALTPPADTAASAPVAAPAVAAASAATAAPAAASAPVAMASAAPAVAATASASAVPAASIAQAAASSAVAASAASPALASDGIVVFRAKAQSWIQVRDARGNSVLQKLLQAGETAGATGALPLTVTVGNVPATDVQVRGRPFDMAAVTKDNVARFEVK